MWIKPMIDQFLAGLILSISAIGLLSGCSTDKAPSGPPLDRVATWQENPEYHIGNEATLLEWMNDEAPARTVYNPEYRWPNGLASSMTPFLVDWEKTSWSVDDAAAASNRFAVVNNVYMAGNPMIGEVCLATIRIPARSIMKVEYVVVRYNLKGFSKTGGHVQLRFVFDPARRPQLLNPDGSVNQTAPVIDDLVLSWETWRPTRTPWEFKAVLDPKAYVFTARLYAGRQRFLQDSLRGAVWDCYPLDLSMHESAADTVLLSGLLIGDGVGRELIWGMLEDGLINDPTDEVKRNWKDEDQERARKMFAWEGMPEHPIKPYLKGVDTGYHVLQRSCINATLKQIDVAMQWLHETYDLGPRQNIDVAPVKIPKWFDDVAEGKQWSRIYRAPYALFWLIGHSKVFPYKSYTALKAADLLQKDENGNVIFYRYGHKESSPYGPLKERIM